MKICEECGKECHYTAFGYLCLCKGGKKMKVIEMPKRVNQDVVNILEAWLAQAKNGELDTVSLVGYRTDNSWQTGASSTDNNLRDCAMLMELAIRRMGFVMKEGV